MALWLSAIIPENLWHLIAPISLIIAGHIVQKNFIGRITMFSNAIAINVFVLSIMNVTQIPNLLIWYANLGLILGIAGLFAYELAQTMPPLYYTITMMYNSIIIGLIMLFYIT